MHASFTDILAAYDYQLPPELIAQAPASPRDSARLLVCDRKTGKRSWTTFADILAFLPKNCVLVLNHTKVIPAKVRLLRASGGAVTVLSLGVSGECIRILSNRRLKEGEFLSLHQDIGFTVKESADKEWLLEPSFPIVDLPVILEKYGSMPLPPYIKESPLSDEDLKREYQTVFAQEPGSIAAPTASLHFTEKLLEQIQASGIQIIPVILHVHLGTFARLTEDQWREGTLHEEFYSIPKNSIRSLEEAKKNGQNIIAVGTTVVRTLESASDEKGMIIKPEGSTSLFIREGYRFHLVDGLITNYHVPKSSLMMLVAALTGRERLLDLYRESIQKKMRFYSFGDGMLIL